jgi:hypothetical protein
MGAVRSSSSAHGLLPFGRLQTAQLLERAAL